MEVFAIIIMVVGLTLAPLIGFFYPGWREIKGNPLSEKELYGIRMLGIGVLLICFVISQVGFRG
ncbi:hypothetical protein [Halobacillus litoralis]|uniref:hypothetical protein n=1 Tax=Halobacillus litoralis TaxID=45668 RepID=UPI001CFF0013|nr:hypothetical protein [Halobacillus litoralis]